ncbi:hypothetical protein TNCT_494521 [Trichonephila clavata]|uniref:Uncharacterized protein n=1 Tax=Trichonephila clavata TaxID=2740835 RepID=A0A8X6FKN8_TRICU|nr:hypothetical protein TNCT_494521 [Trichonephila clavata]
MGAYHLNHVHLLPPKDYSLFNTFAARFLQYSNTNSAFSAPALLKDEACITREGALSMTLMCTLQNPHRTQLRASQQHFSVKVWTGILRDYRIAPHLLDSPLNGRAYLILFAPSHPRASLRSTCSSIVASVHVVPS